MNYQPNQQGNFPPQQPYQGQPNQMPYPQQPVQQMPMQPQMQMSQPMAPVQPMMQMSQPMQPMQQMPVQQMPPMQQTGSMPYMQQQDQFASSQPYMPVQQGFDPSLQQPAVQPMTPVQEKTNPLQPVLDFIREHQLYYLIGSAAIAVLYLLFILLFSGWNLGRLIPFLIVLVLSLGLTGAAIYLRKKIISIAAGAGYVLCMLLFLNYFFVLLPSAALCVLDFFSREE